MDFAGFQTVDAAHSRHKHAGATAKGMIAFGIFDRKGCRCGGQGVHHQLFIHINGVAVHAGAVTFKQFNNFRMLKDHANFSQYF